MFYNVCMGSITSRPRDFRSPLCEQSCQPEMPSPHLPAQTMSFEEKKIAVNAMYARCEDIITHLMDTYDVDQRLKQRRIKKSKKSVRNDLLEIISRAVQKAPSTTVIDDIIRREFFVYMRILIPEWNAKTATRTASPS